MTTVLIEHPATDPAFGEDAPRRRRWTVAEYERMAEVGLLGPEERVELIDGEIVERAPQKSRHFTGGALAYRSLQRVFGEAYSVRQQGPLDLGAATRPEPDLAVVSGSIEDYAESHPHAAVLIVEVSDTTLQYDRGAKASLYAKAGVLDYWIVDLVNGRLEVRRDPVPAEGEPFGYRYATLTVHEPSDSVSPLAALDAQIAVSDLLPRTSHGSVE